MTRTVLLALSMLLPALQSMQSSDEQQLTRLIDTFQHLDANTLLAKQILADDYVHVTADGSLTTSWFVEQVQPTVVTRDRLSLRVFGDAAVATYRWQSDGTPARRASIAQVFQKRGMEWRIIATQVGGPGTPLAGPIATGAIVPPVNPPASARELREAWARQLLAADLKTPEGEHAEDLDTIRSIFAEDAMYVNPDGSVMSREQVLSRGHPNTVQLTGKQVEQAIAENKFFHIDERFGIFGNLAVWTSRNPANRDQSLRVYMRRPNGWQMIFVHHGMSVR